MTEKRGGHTLIDVGNFIRGLLSGRDFPVLVLPRPLLFISLVLPLTYGYDSLRALLIGTRTLVPLVLEAGLAVVSMAAMLVCGLWAFARIERHCRAQGTLAHH